MKPQIAVRQQAKTNRWSTSLIILKIWRLDYENVIYFPSIFNVKRFNYDPEIVLFGCFFPTRQTSGGVGADMKRLNQTKGCC